MNLKNRFHLNCFLIFVTVGMIILCSACSPTENGTEFVLSEMDWLPQDYLDSRGISSVEYQDAILLIDADMKTGDDERSQGEIWLDLSLTPGFEGMVPVNLSNTVIEVEVWVPDTFAGPSETSSGVQICGKDYEWNSCYSSWLNIEIDPLSDMIVDCIGNIRLFGREKGGVRKLTLHPGPGSGNIISNNFDETRCRFLGVKFAMNTRGEHSFQGKLGVLSYCIKPTLNVMPKPNLPVSPPSALAPEERLDLQDNGFIVGANYGLVAYAQNFSSTNWFPNGQGVSRRYGFIRTNLEYAVRAGIKLVRVGLLDDGRAVLDQNAHVTNYSDVFTDDVEALLSIAEEIGCRIHFVLIDYQLAGKSDEVDGVYLRGREELLQDATTRKEFITNFLEPFLKKFGSHPALYGIDLINEPEWLISKEEGGGWENKDEQSENPLPRADLLAYANDCIATIRTYAPTLYITIGVSAPFIELTQNIPIDYYGLHYYTWMGDFSEVLKNIPDEKPWMLEEFPSQTGPLKLTDYLNKSMELGASGALFWNLTPDLDDQTFSYTQRNQILEELRDWVDKKTKRVSLDNKQQKKAD